MTITAFQSQSINGVICIYHSTNYILEEIENVSLWVLIRMLVRVINYLFPVPNPAFKLCRSIKLLGFHSSNNLKWDIHSSLIFNAASHRAYAFSYLKTYSHPR